MCRCWKINSSDTSVLRIFYALLLLLFVSLAQAQTSAMLPWKMDCPALLKSTTMESDDAKIALGECYIYGMGVAIDNAKALAIFRELEHRNHPMAWYFLAQMYQSNMYGLSADTAISRQYFEKALPGLKALADQGYAPAQYKLGRMYESGSGVPKEETTAVEWYRKAALQGYAVAQTNLGWMYESGSGVPKEETTAVEWYRKAALQGYDAAQTNLGWMYANGRGVPKEESIAVEWYRKAALQGYARAQFNLGVKYATGRGVPKEESIAVEWYRKAAQQGYVSAQTNLGRMYESGSGVPKEETTAVEWYRKAAQQGYASAQTNLGWMYESGSGVPKEESIAVEWYRKAAQQGDANAQFNLGKSYENGTGVQRDYANALDYYRKAADQGAVDAQKSYDRLSQLVNRPAQRWEYPSSYSVVLKTTSISSGKQFTANAGMVTMQKQELYAGTPVTFTKQLLLMQEKSRYAGQLSQLDSLFRKFRFIRFDPNRDSGVSNVAGTIRIQGNELLIASGNDGMHLEHSVSTGSIGWVGGALVDLQDFKRKFFLSDTGTLRINGIDYFYGEGASLSAEGDGLVCNRFMALSELQASKANEGLLMAAQRGHMDVLLACLSNGWSVDSMESDPNEQTRTEKGRAPIRRTALMLAAQEGHEAIVDSLLSHHANVNLADMDGMTALSYAAKNGRLSLVRKLLDRGGKDLQKSLEKAILANQFEVADTLILRDKKVNKSSKVGDKNFLDAAGRGKNEIPILQALIGLGVSADTRNKEGQNAIMLALNVEASSAAHCDSVVSFLLDAGASANVSDLKGNTPLMAATTRGFLSTVKILVEHGARIDAKRKKYTETTSVPKDWVVDLDNGTMKPVGERKVVTHKGGESALELAADKPEILDYLKFIKAKPRTE